MHGMRTAGRVRMLQLIAGGLARGPYHAAAGPQAAAAVDAAVADVAGLAMRVDMELWAAAMPSSSPLCRTKTEAHPPREGTDSPSTPLAHGKKGATPCAKGAASPGTQRAHSPRARAYPSCKGLPPHLSHTHPMQHGIRGYSPY